MLSCHLRLIVVLAIASSITACHFGAAAKASSGADLPAVTATGVTLSAAQAATLGFATATQRKLQDWLEVPAQIDADGDHSLPIFSPYNGRIVACYVHPGDHVERGTPLFSFSSPDLIQAENAYLSARANLALTQAALHRAHPLQAAQEIALKDLEQATADFNTAQAAERAARQTLLSMGLPSTALRRLQDQGEITATLTVYSPMAGLISDRQAQVGLFVQAGNAPAPYTLSGQGQLWLDAALPEGSGAGQVGTPFHANTLADPEHTLQGRIVYRAFAEDPVTHTLLARAVLDAPTPDLHPGMFVSMSVQNGTPHLGVTVPDDAVVREPDGTTSLWTSSDRRHFVVHTVHVGLEEDGWTEIIDGVTAGTQVVTLGAINLSNILHASGDD